MSDVTRQRWIAFGLVTVGAFAVFLAALPEGITGGDAGELSVAAYFLGIPHPPGYPTWCLAAHPFTWIPFGSIAWRVALSSAVFGALTCGIVALIIHRLTRRWEAAIVAGMALVYSRPFYSQATIVEVYALNALLFSLCVYLLLVWRRERDWRYLYVIALLCGLGQGVHNTMTLLTPVFAVLVVANGAGILWEGRRILLCAGFFLLGCSTFLYLPIRSVANPPVDWGNPETWENLRALVLREQFAFMYDQYPRGAHQYLEQLRGVFLASLPAVDDTLQFVLALCSLFGIFVYLMSEAWVVPVLAVLSLSILWRRDVWAGALLLCTALLPVLAITWVQNPLSTAEWDEVMVPFQIPLVWGMVIAAACWIGRNREEMTPKQYKYGLVVATVAVLVLALFAYLDGPGQEEDTWVGDYAGNILRQLPQDAILFAGPDHAAFPILYRQAVDGERPDVKLGNPYGYVDVSLVADAPEELRRALGPRPARGVEAQYFSWLLAHTTRPVYFSQAPKLEADSPVKFRQEGLLYRAVVGAGDAGATPTWPKDYEWPVEDGDVYADELSSYVERQIAAEWYLKQLTVEFSAGRPQPQRIRIIEELAERDPEHLNNLALLLARNGREDRAQELLEKALVCDPGNETVRRNLERLKARM